jgi:hypothetical protein
MSKDWKEIVAVAKPAGESIYLQTFPHAQVVKGHPERISNVNGTTFFRVDAGEMMVIRKNTHHVFEEKFEDAYEVSLPEVKDVKHYVPVPKKHLRELYEVGCFEITNKSCYLNHYE